MKSSTLTALLALRSDKVPGVLVTDLGSGAQTLLREDMLGGELTLGAEGEQAASAALREDRSRTVEIEGRKLFFQVYNPPLRLFVVGAVHISQALAPMAAMLGYDVTIVDPRQSFATEARFPNVRMTHDWPDEALARFGPDRRSAIVTLTHDPKLDDPALEGALRSPAFYIGALGSRKTHGLRVERLRQAGFSEDEIGRINGPIGLAIGAKSPAEIALAIMAQVTETLRRGPAPAADRAS